VIPGRALVPIVVALCAICSIHTSAVVRKPSVLIHCARSTVDQWYWWVDLDYLRELHTSGFEVDYTDVHSDLTWERVRRYDVLVIYVSPLDNGAYYDNSPDLPPYRDRFIEIVEKFLASGGGVFLMARSLNADETFLPLIERWGARIPYERIEETDPTNLAPLPRMRGADRIWFTDNVSDSPVSDGVAQVWLPLTRHYAVADTMPIQVSPEWHVVLRGTETSHTVPIDPENETMLAPADALAREGGVREPDLFAIRRYKAGRIAFCAIWPQYSIGQGTRWLYDRRVLSRGVEERASHFGRLIENTLRWLAQPGTTGSEVGGYTADPQRFVPPNERKGVGDAFVRHSLARVADASAAMSAVPAGGTLRRGLIGAQTALGSGNGAVADYAAAAREAGLDFVVFLEDFASLTAAKLETLKQQCRSLSGPDLQLYPGYRLETNTENRIFLFGREVALPPPELLVDGRFNQQYQDRISGAFLEHQSPLIDWLNHRMLASQQVNVGYFGFTERQNGQRVGGLRLYSMLALRLFRDGALVEDNLDAYLTSAAGTIPPVPAAVHLLGSPTGLRKAARTEVGLTYARSRSVDGLWQALGYSDTYTAPNVFTTDGPMIEAWPQARQYYTFAAEDYVARAAYLAAPVVVRSAVGLREIRIYDGERLFRRFLCNGDKEFRHVLELSAGVQRTLVLVAEDVDGGRAVSTALRCWKGGDLTVFFCGDRINHCDGAPLLAKGPGSFQVSRIPLIHGGHTWDGGPRGEHPIMRFTGALRPTLVSDGGREGERGFDNLPILEFADEGSVRVRSVLDRLFDDRIPVVNPWVTFGPLGGPSRLLRAEVAFTAFDRPTVGPHPDLYPGFPTKSGAELSIFESDLTFKQDQSIDSLMLFMQWWYGGPFPVTLVHGRGLEVLKTYDLSPGKRPRHGPVLRTGDWIGCFGAEPSNLSVHVNRGAPLRLEFYGSDDLGTAFFAALDDARVKKNESLHYEMLSVVDPVDSTRRDLERVLGIVDYLTQRRGLNVWRGRASSSGGESPARNGLVELRAVDGAAALRVKRPKRRVDVPLAVRIDGLNPNWSAGVFLRRGYVLGNYGPGRKRFREVGFDREGRVYATFFPDHAQVTEAVIGHPVVCDRDELFIQVTRRDDRGGPASWHVSVNNPTDQEIRATFRTAIDIPGLDLSPRTMTVPPGAYLFLH